MEAMFFVAAQSKETGRCVNRCFRAANAIEAKAKFAQSVRYWSDKTYEPYSAALASEQQVYAHFAHLVSVEAIDAEYALERTKKQLAENLRWLNQPL